MTELLKCYEKSCWKLPLTWLPRSVFHTVRRAVVPVPYTLLLIVGIFVSGCNEQILHDLSEPEANKVVSRLSAGDLGAQKVLQSDGRWAIAVPRDKMIPALAYLDTNRVLTPRTPGVGAGGKGGFVPSREEQWFRYERSVASSIEESLGTIHGVLEARVHLNLPETDPLFGTRKEDVGSGSVLLVIDPQFVTQDQDIAAMVAGAAGVPSSKVTVLRTQAVIQVQKEASQRESSTPMVEPHVIVNPVSDDASQGLRIDHVLVHADVGLASLGAIIACGCAVKMWRRRGRRATFSLPESDDVEV